ncbi:MAG: hypothetical protein Kow00106_07150 [Anaerolineae bacterium]
MVNIYRDIGAGSKDTGGLWEQLDRQIARQAAAPLPEGMGLWGMIVAGSVGGVWDAFDSETVLLRADALKRPRRDVWREASDETLILPKEGLLPIWDAVLAQTNAAAAAEVDGTLLLLRQEADSVWQRSAEETLVMARPAESVFAQQIRARDLASFRPQRLPGYALKKLTDARGETYWILKNLRTDAYLRLSAEQVFLWEQMDGGTSVQDMAIAYMLTYGKLAIGSLIALLEQLQQKAFIAPLVDVYGAVDRSVAQRRANVWWRRAIRAFIHSEIAIGGIDGLISRSYQAIGRWFFTPLVQWLMLAVMLVGGAAFLALLFGLVDRRVAVLGGAGAIAGLLTLYVLQACTLLIHEWAHAIATKHYGRTVQRGGVMLHFGMPAAFVDTTDIWMEPRRPRLVVSWAGPHSGFFLGGLASLLVLAGPGPVLQGILFQFALLTYLTSFTNLNPLLKLDGYYILMDWLEMPRLRERSLAFIGKPLRDKLRRRQPFSRDERIFAIFGALAGLWTVIAVSTVVLTVGTYALRFVQTTPGLLVSGAVVLALGWHFGWRRLRQTLARRSA